MTTADGATARGTGRLAAERESEVEPHAARLLLALGVTGDLERAAELAQVDLEQAKRWTRTLRRPHWMSRRGEVARELFQVGKQALDEVRRRLTGGAPVTASGNNGQQPADTPQIPLRELVMVAERFFTAAIRLDKYVGSNGDAKFVFRLDHPAGEADDGPAGDAQGAADRDA